jgi:Ca-activated chloride channel family protein
LLLGHLRPDDHVAIVTYAEEPRLALLPTPALQTRDILRALEPLEAKGGTNGGAGLELAYDLARAHFSEGGPNGIILCSDGDFNVGSTREEDLARLIDREAKTQVTLSVLGFGRGRAIDPRLEAMAKHGGGRSGYVNTRRDAELALTRELDELFEPLAKNVKIEVAFNPDRVQGYRLVGYDDVPDNLDSGAAPPDARTVLPGHALTALYEVVPVTGAPSGDMLTVKVSYQTPKDGAPHLQQFPLKDGGVPFARSSLEFKFAAAVATFGLVLQNSPQKGPLTLDEVEAWARECLGQDEGGYRSEFLSLVEQARAARR